MSKKRTDGGITPIIDDKYIPKVMVIKLEDKKQITVTKLGGTTKTESNIRDPEDPKELKAAFDVLESAILAHAHEGIDVSEARYVKGIQTAYDKAIEAFYD